MGGPLNPLDCEHYSWFKANLKNYYVGDCIEYSVEDGAPPKPYVWVNNILVPKEYVNFYMRMHSAHGTIFHHVGIFAGMEGDALFKFKVRVYTDILQVVDCLAKLSDHLSPDSCSIFDQCDKIIKRAEDLGCCVFWIRLWLEELQEDYALEFEGKSRLSSKMELHMKKMKIEGDTLV